MHNAKKQKIESEMCIKEDFIRSNLERNTYLSLYITNEVASNKWRRMCEFVYMAHDKESL